MKIPQFWARGTAEDIDRSGKKISFSCWRWSHESEQDARQRAVDAARRVLVRLQNGEKPDRYLYGQQPLREEKLRELRNTKGDVTAIITRNSYGCEILNAAAALFIDIDIPKSSLYQNIVYFLTKRINQQTLSPRKRAETTIRARLDHFVGSHSNWGLRVYRTFGGMRCLATHALFEPSSSDTQHILEILGSDPLYNRLCRWQDSFRARLTPKPWRCGHYANVIHYPWEDANQQLTFEDWHQQYITASQNFATCHLLGTIGNEVIHPELEEIVTFHDRETKCLQSIQLA